MRKIFLLLGALFGGLAVGLGAFGAHGLQRITTDETILRSYQTAVQYQMYHALALIAVALLHERLNAGLTRWSGNFFVGGIVLFSGSLYAITFLKINGKEVSDLVGILTPIGGMSFILGWLFLFIATIRSLQRQT